LYRTSRIGGGD
jgi:hypothetical protein